MSESEVERLRRDRDQYREAWKLRGRQYNEDIERLTADRDAERARAETAEARLAALEGVFQRGTRDALRRIWVTNEAVAAALAAAGSRVHGEACAVRRGGLPICTDCGCWCHMNPAIVAPPGPVAPE